MSVSPVCVPGLSVSVSVSSVSGGPSECVFCECVLFEVSFVEVSLCECPL